MKGRILFTHLIADVIIAPTGTAWRNLSEDSATISIVVTNSENVSWWAGIVEHGCRMPLSNGYSADMRGNNYQNQGPALLLSGSG